METSKILLKVNDTKERLAPESNNTKGYIELTMNVPNPMHNSNKY